MPKRVPLLLFVLSCAATMVLTPTQVSARAAPEQKRVALKPAANKAPAARAAPSARVAGSSAKVVRAAPGARAATAPARADTREARSNTRNARIEPRGAASPRGASRSTLVIDRPAVRSADRRRTAGPAVAAAGAKAGARRNQSLAAADTRLVRRHGRLVRVPVVAQPTMIARPSIGQAIGLHAVEDPLDLRSSVAMVVDQQTGETLFSKNAQAVLPIASITKLMTALVVLDANLSLADPVEVSELDIDTEKGSRSRLRPGTRLSRGEMLQLALMSSENRAAHALGRHYPGGMPAFVAAMNAKARQLGMTDTSFVEPTGLSSSNVSNARDLARLVVAAAQYPLVRQFSTANGLTVDTGVRMLNFHNTNRLISNPTWEIGLQKTGYISEAGSCLVMHTNIDGRPVVMVLLDANGKLSRFGDAERIRQWLENESRRPHPVRADSGVRRDI
jgi:D-alanyl-D-alanine endopeptidase (penicillin-binding protein 7)